MMLRAGAARVSISPRPEDFREGVYLGGFGAYRQRRASGVRDEPQCRAAVLSDGEQAVAIAALDLVGASGPLLARVRDGAAKRTGIAPERVLIACTHSHASPDTQGLWGGVPRAYEAHVAARAIAAIGEAHAALRDARASAATTQLGGLVRNRRGWPETDTALTTLRLADSSGATIGTIVNYACHPTASGAANTEVSRDWCGVAADAVEAALGGVAIYINGAIGDVNPARDGVPAMVQLGEAVAQAAVASLDAADDVTGPVVVNTAPLLLPLQLERLSERVQAAVVRVLPGISLADRAGALHAVALALHKAGRADVAQLVAALAGMGERRIERRDGRSYVATHCGYLRIGGVEAYCAPGEILTRLGLPLRASLGGRHRMLFGLTHDTLGYFVPEDEWMSGRNNNYEEGVSMGRRAAAALDAALRALAPRAEEAAP